MTIEATKLLPVMVKGRMAYIVEGYTGKFGHGFAIFDREPGYDGQTLSEDGDWIDLGRGKQFRCKEKEAAAQFLAQNADQPPAPPLNLDHDEARALHRIVRAMHDGECPKCHKVWPCHRMRFSDFHVTDAFVVPPLGYVEKEGWRCPATDCKFEITDDEAAEVFRIFAPFMERNLAIFEKWRASRVSQ